MYCANLICMSSLYSIPFIHLLQTHHDSLHNNTHALPTAQYTQWSWAFFSVALLAPRFIHFDFVEKNLFFFPLFVTESKLNKSTFSRSFFALFFFFFFFSLIRVLCFFCCFCSTGFLRSPEGEEEEE